MLRSLVSDVQERENRLQGGRSKSDCIGAKISKYVANKGTMKRLKEIILNFNAKNNKINKQLAKAGYKYLKIGRDGLEKIYTTIYKEEGYKTLEHGIGYGLSFIFKLF